MEEPKTPNSAAGWTERTAADLSSLLVELGRVLKGVAFYGRGSETTRDLADRAFRALASDLDRAGPLELALDVNGFRAEGVREVITFQHLGDLEGALRAAAISQIRFTEGVTAESLRSFVEALPLAGDTAVEVTSRPGIEVNCAPCPPQIHRPRITEPEPAPAARKTGGNVRKTAGRAPQTAGEPFAPPAASLGSALIGRGRIERSEVKRSIDESPLEAPASDDESARLVFVLRELDACTEDDLYIDLARQAAETARTLSEAGLIEEGYRTQLVLSDHAVGEGGRSALQARIALATLVELATGVCLEELINRACSADTRTAVRAAQVLLLLGEGVVPALLDRLEADPESPQNAQISGLLIALGERTVPALTAAILSGSGPRTRLAIRIGGELQCPALAEPLREILCDEGRSLQKEAAKALVEMGNGAALNALLDALASERERVAEIAAFCLGALGAPSTLPSLCTRLDQATPRKQWRLAREILRSIGQFQECDPATAAALLAWVQRGGARWKRPDLDLKLEAVTALGQLAGRPARDALRCIAGKSSPRAQPRLRKRAQRILDRRG